MRAPALRKVHPGYFGGRGGILSPLCSRHRKQPKQSERKETNHGAMPFLSLVQYNATQANYCSISSFQLTLR